MKTYKDLLWDKQLVLGQKLRNYYITNKGTHTNLHSTKTKLCINSWEMYVDITKYRQELKVAMSVPVSTCNKLV